MRKLIRVAALMMSILLAMGSFLPVSHADNLLEMEAYFYQAEKYNRLIDVAGKGEMRFYAQNEPLWGALIYENASTTTRRPFRDSGCNPSAAAMALVQVVPLEQLRLLSEHTKRPFSLCTCSVNKARCQKSHVRYYVTTDEDYLRFLPLLLGDYAAGNNTHGANSRNGQVGTAPAYLKDLELIFGIRLAVTQSLDEACQAAAKGYGVMAMAGKGGVFTSTGHYILLAHSDENNIYFLDPLQRDPYTTDKQKRLEIIEPGFVALSRDQIRYAELRNFIIFIPAEAQDSLDDGGDWNALDAA